MNWQEVLAQNQATGNAAPSVPRENSVTPYMPLIFNARSPEGQAAIALVGNALNSWIGGYKDRGDKKKFAAAMGDVNANMPNAYGSIGNLLNASEKGNVAAMAGDDTLKQWTANAGLTGEKKYFVDNLQKAKNDWQMGFDAGNQGRMDEAAKRAAELRQMAADRNIDLTGYDANTSLADFKQHYGADSRATLDSVRNQLSSGDYYNRLVDAGMAQGMTRKSAERYAAQEASKYQSGLMKQYQAAMNDYGYDGEGQLSRAGIELANLMSGEGGKEQVKNLLGSNLSPAQVAKMNADVEEREKQRQFTREENEANRNLRREESAANRAMRYGLASMRGNGGGGGGRGGKGGGVMTMNDMSPMDFVAYYRKMTGVSGDNLAEHDGFNADFKDFMMNKLYSNYPEINTVDDMNAAVANMRSMRHVLTKQPLFSDEEVAKFENNLRQQLQAEGVDVPDKQGGNSNERSWFDSIGDFASALGSDIYAANRNSAHKETTRNESQGSHKTPFEQMQAPAVVDAARRDAQRQKEIDDWKQRIRNAGK